MEHEKDFCTGEIVDLDVKGYKKGEFKYLPVDANQENEWLDDYLEVDKEGKPKQNFAKLNKLKLNNLTAVIYDQALIKKMINIDKEWKDLNIDERWSLLGKLRGSVFDLILTAINKVDKGDTAAKKD